MRHRKQKKILSRPAAARKALLRDLMTSLVLHGRITTTAAKGRVVRSSVERLLTHAKKGTLAGRRRVLAELRTPEAVQKTMTVLGPRFAHRAGGYTRLRKLGYRTGDGAPLVQLEILS